MKAELQSLFALRDSFEREDGERLIQAALSAIGHRQFNFIALLVIPKWIVLLEETLRRGNVLLAQNTRAWLYIALEGHRLPFIEESLPDDLELGSEIAIAACTYCLDKNIYFAEATRVNREWTAAPDPFIGYLEQPSASELHNRLRASGRPT